MAATTVWVLEDQLVLDHPGFPGDPRDITVLLVESRAWATAVPHHKQKLVFVWSAMRHYAEELRGRGFTVDYHQDAEDHATALGRHVRRHHPTHLVLMESAEYGVSDSHRASAEALGLRTSILANTMFLSSRAAFAGWAKGRKQLRLELFYRRMRRTTGLLMDGSEPTGGQWNYDRENRRRPARNHRFPSIPRFEPDAIARDVMALVERRYPNHFGDTTEFAWPVTRRDAEVARNDFLAHRLVGFGDYQDAIVDDEPHLYHSLLSPLLNVGLLEPRALCGAVEHAYRNGQAPINATEGFIRQIIGWREYVYQLYWLKMPAYRQRNTLRATRPLPEFYWSGNTSMRCVSNAVTSLRHHGINHHIQRLMVTGNFALLAGLRPREVNEWYWLAYVDAWDWVVTPNVIGMALHADGGLVGSKPYAASANYLKSMSDHCAPCRYEPTQTTGPDACPFNSLYWDFLARHRARFLKNPRMRLMLTNLEKKAPAELAAVRAQARRVLRELAPRVARAASRQERRPPTRGRASRDAPARRRARRAKKR